MDLSIIQGPVSVAPCQTRISRFATFFIAVEQAALAELRRLRARASDAGLLPAHGGTTMQKLRIVRLGFGTS